ncbi:MAG: 16S rRNA (cytidine(1402)-2'-O)-methyltransferase [Pseudomonadota bacterium]|nr:16S rRNA (cytidine(1402)-2'-O)-methyltransferase [Pseudomonadota bacterium]
MSAPSETGPGFLIGSSRFAAPPLAAGLYLVATPIGHLRDITLRALETLAAAAVVFCEDTRVTAKLLTRYGLRKELKPYHDHNAAKVRPLILNRVAAGESVALTCDAGTPLISDPGFRLVQEAIGLNLPVEMIPGPSAPLMALVLSGLPTDRFLFAGFLPARAGERRRRLAELKDVPATLLFFDTPPRIADTLTAIEAVLGPRPVCIARELTKLHQEVLRGKPREVLAAIAARGGLRGEITLVVAPPGGEHAPDADADVERALGEALRSMSTSRAAAHVARKFNRPRRAVYDLALKLRELSAGEPGEN